MPQLVLSVSLPVLQLTFLCLSVVQLRSGPLTSVALVCALSVTQCFLFVLVLCTLVVVLACPPRAPHIYPPKRALSLSLQRTSLFSGFDAPSTWRRQHFSKHNLRSYLGLLLLEAATSATADEHGSANMLPYLKSNKRSQLLWDIHA